MTQRTDMPLDPAYEISLFADNDRIGADDVLELWDREQVVGPDEAKRRIHEVLLVATTVADGKLCGVSSAYLQRSRQLRMDLWFYRAFVAHDHRLSNVAVQLALRGRDLLEHRYVTGEDTRAPGIVYEVENEGLKRYFPEALWMPTRFVFVGENGRGDHVRVFYFPGAMVPVP